MLGLESIDVAISLNNIGSIHYQFGDYQKALAHYKRCLSIRQKVLGYESFEVSTTWSDLGSIYLKKRDYSEALDYYSRCVEIRKKILDPGSGSIAESLSYIKMVEDSKNKLKKECEIF